MIMVETIVSRATDSQLIEWTDSAAPSDKAQAQYHLIGLAHLSNASRSKILLGKDLCDADHLIIIRKAIESGGAVHRELCEYVLLLIEEGAL